MSWVLADFLMFFSSVVLFLIIRKATLAKIPSPITNVVMFGVPAFFYDLFNLAHLDSFLALTPALIALLVIGSIIFGYMSNAASLKSISLAPNPGYSLVISKSSVVLTIFLAVPLLGSVITWNAIAAVLMIVAFSMLILLNPRGSHRAKSQAWLPLALVAFVGWAFLSLMAKYLFIHGATTLVFLDGLFTIVAICAFIEIRLKRIHLGVLKQNWRLLLQIGLASTVWNFFLFYAIKIAPNPGYVNATNAASIAIVTLLATWFFKDELTIRKCIGVFGVIGGLCFLFLQ
jgi:drug/metabolite transporter (DMT)-like permease